MSIFVIIELLIFKIILISVVLAFEENKLRYKNKKTNKTYIVLLLEIFLSLIYYLIVCSIVVNGKKLIVNNKFSDGFKSRSS